MAYERPPITEAVIDLQLSDFVKNDSFEKARLRLGRSYDSQKEENDFNIDIDPVGQTSKFSVDQTWFRLLSKDQYDVTLLKPNSLTVCRLAPYLGWDQLWSRAVRDQSVWRDAVGVRRISRIGTRFINRIDIPAPPNDSITINDYLNFSFNVPLPTALNQFSLSVSLPVGRDNLKVTIKSATVKSPLIGHISIMLDIDVWRDDEFSQSLDTVWSIVANMRDVKNRIFEGCITNRARELFSA